MPSTVAVSGPSRVVKAAPSPSSTGAAGGRADPHEQRVDRDRAELDLGGEGQLDAGAPFDCEARTRPPDRGELERGVDLGAAQHRLDEPVSLADVDDEATSLDDGADGRLAADAVGCVRPRR